MSCMVRASQSAVLGERSRDMICRNIYPGVFSNLILLAVRNSQEMLDPIMCWALLLGLSTYH